MGKTVSDLLFVNLYLISLSLAVLLLLRGPEVPGMIRCCGDKCVISAITSGQKKSRQVCDNYEAIN